MHETLEANQEEFTTKETDKELVIAAVAVLARHGIETQDPESGQPMLSVVLAPHWRDENPNPEIRPATIEISQQAGAPLNLARDGGLHRPITILYKDHDEHALKKFWLRPAIWGLKDEAFGMQINKPEEPKYAKPMPIQDANMILRLLDYVALEQYFRANGLPPK